MLRQVTTILLVQDGVSLGSSDHWVASRNTSLTATESRKSSFGFQLQTSDSKSFALNEVEDACKSLCEYSSFCHVTCHVSAQTVSFRRQFCFFPSQSVSVVLSRAKAMANPALTDDAVSPGAVAWVLTSTAFVFLMTAGLGFFYGGLVRDTNIINTMMMSVVSMGIVTLTWMVFGFSWAFGDNGSTGFGMFIGNFDYSLWMGLDMKMWGDSGLPGLVFAAFQMTFAIISSAIISGSLWSACVSVLTASCLLCGPF